MSMMTDPVEVKVLDQGYVKLIQCWGSDELIIEAARMSTDKGFQGWGPRHAPKCYDAMVAGADCSCKFDTPGDEKLLRYLYEHKHMTPFEMAGMTLEVQAPIFVFREWHRHRTQSYNELSARYTTLPDMFYLPDNARVRSAGQSKTNKQSSEARFTYDEADYIRERLSAAMADSRKAYDELLALGVAREIARIVIPTAQYSRMRASANLRNWLAFLTLRMDVAAQAEIRCYANAVWSIAMQEFKRTMMLFNGNPS